jgi:GTP pyrophosphokinase
VAERGIAAHWRYRDIKSDPGEPTENRAYEWLREMVDLLEQGSTAEEFMEQSKLNLFQDQVFCFTPKGNLIPLPRGATPIDFAYQVHTDLGHRTLGAKVNGIPVPLYTPLRNGDQVEIIAGKDETPSPMWEQFVVTGRARAEIRKFIRQQQRGEHIKFGRKILEKVFADEEMPLTDKAVETVATKLGLSKVEDVFAQIGHGGLRARDVLDAVYPELKLDPERRQRALLEQPVEGKRISIRGLTEGVAYKIGTCCHPLPGDRIVGLMMPGEGAIIHTIDCAELERAQSDKNIEWLDVAWGHHAAEMGPSVARLKVRVRNANGSLGAAMTAIGNAGGNIFNMKTIARNPLYFEFQVDVVVRDVVHLQNILGSLRVTEVVESVDRVREPEPPQEPSASM